MHSNPTNEILDFLERLDTSTEPFRRFETSDIDDTKAAMLNIAELTLVIDLLAEYGAPVGLRGAVATAMINLSVSIDGDIQKELLRLAFNSSCTRPPAGIQKLMTFVSQEAALENYFR